MRCILSKSSTCRSVQFRETCPCSCLRVSSALLDCDRDKVLREAKASFQPTDLDGRKPRSRGVIFFTVMPSGSSQSFFLETCMPNFGALIPALTSYLDKLKSKKNRQACQLENRHAMIPPMWALERERERGHIWRLLGCRRARNLDILAWQHFVLQGPLQFASSPHKVRRCGSLVQTRAE